MNIMGGTVIETESEKLIRKGREAGRSEGRTEEIIEMGREFGLDDAAIMSRTDFADIQNKNECGDTDNGKDNF